MLDHVDEDYAIGSSTERTPLAGHIPCSNHHHLRTENGFQSLLDDANDAAYKDDEAAAAAAATEATATGGSVQEEHGTDATTDATTTPTSSRHHHHTRRHSRTDSTGSILLDNIFDSVLDVKDIMVEEIEHVQEVFVEQVDHIKENVEEVIDEIKDVLEEPVAEPVQPREVGDHSRKLNAIALAVIVFYKVSGGPFGSEPTVQAAGPLGAILGFIIFPIFWCIPEALITAELGSAYPEPSGAIAWVEEAFGSGAGLLCGYFHYISGATDNAIYPSLLLEYIASYLQLDDDYWADNGILRFGLAIAITIALSIVNYTGLEIVGKVSILVCIVSMSPFLILCGASIPKLQPSRWMTFGSNDSPIQWRLLLNNLFWNLNSFDAGANFAGEVQDPATVFPKAMFLSIVLVVASYLLPLMAALGASDTDPEEWVAGYFTTVSTTIAGPWLGMWLVFAAAVSNIALYEAELSGDSYCLQGMADRGLIPKVFTKKSVKYDTPINGILLGTFIIMALSVANFEQLVEMLNFAMSLSLLLEFAAFVKLRITHAHVDRPYRIPLNTFGCVLFVTPPTFFLLYLMTVASNMTYVYMAVLFVVGGFFHFMQKVAKHYELVEYVEAPIRHQPPPPTTAITATKESITSSSCSSIQ